jgi:hypothetical protein
MQHVCGWARLGGGRGWHRPLSQDIQEGQGDTPPFASAPVSLTSLGPVQVALVTAASAITNPGTLYSQQHLLATDFTSVPGYGGHQKAAMPMWAIGLHQQ